MPTIAEIKAKQKRQEALDRAGRNEPARVVPDKSDAGSIGGMFNRFLEGMADPIYGASAP